MALPAGTRVVGRVSSIEPLSRKRRALAIANGDFTPLRKAHVDFDTLVLKDGTRIPLHASISEGVPNVVHLTAGGTTTERLFVEQFPVGIIPGAEYRAARAACGSEDVFVMLTDGIVEVANTTDEEFGLERVERLLLENATRPLVEIAERIIGAATFLHELLVNRGRRGRRQLTPHRKFLNERLTQDAITLQ
jgi:stage II sporulation SpoE-like protein